MEHSSFVQESTLPIILEGKGINGGIATGYAFFHEARIYNKVSNSPLLQSLACKAKEKDKILKALQLLRNDINSMVSQSFFYDDSRKVFETYSLLAHDPGWEKHLLQKIDLGYDAHTAIHDVLATFKKRFSKDFFWQERLYDFEDVSHRLCQYLYKKEEEKKDEVSIHPIIVIAEFLSPADLLEYHQGNLVGLIMTDSDYTSHVAIIAKSLKIPLVCGAQHIFHLVKQSESLIIDGTNGLIYVRSSSSRSIHPQIKSPPNHLVSPSIAQKGSVTLDGIPISLNVNANLIEDFDCLDTLNVDGVGLFRTEISFLMAKKIPHFQDQISFYKKALQKANDKPIFFRTLDLSGDKSFLLQKNNNNVKSLIYDQPLIFRHQVRALIRAKLESHSLNTPLHILLPKVTDVREFLKAKQILQLEIEKVSKLNASLLLSFKIGAMIEVPSLVYQIEKLLPHVDFLSIGSNDLFQFFFGLDRETREMSKEHDFLMPSFLFLLKEIIQKVGDKIPLSLCGEAASQPLNSLALIGLGFKNFSISQESIPLVYDMISKIHLKSLTNFINFTLISIENCDRTQHAMISLRNSIKNFALDHKIIAYK